MFSCSQSSSTQTYSLPTDQALQVSVTFPATALVTTQRDVHNIHIVDAGGVHTTVSSPLPLIPAQSLTSVYLGPPTPIPLSPHHLRQFQLGSKTNLVLIHLFVWYSSLEIYDDVMDSRERFENRRLLSPPDDIVLGHEEYVGFQNPCSGRSEQTREKRNVYYHPWKTCTTPHFLNFDPVHHITVSNYVKEKLLPQHVDSLWREFGIHLQFNMQHGIAYLQPRYTLLDFIISWSSPQESYAHCQPHLWMPHAAQWGSQMVCVCRRSSFPFVSASEPVSVSASEPGRIRLFHLPLFDLPLWFFESSTKQGVGIRG